MKTYLYPLLIILLGGLIFGSIYFKSGKDSPEASETKGDIQETELPKGKSVVEDEIVPSKVTEDNPSTFNGVNGQDNKLSTGATTQTDPDALMRRRYKNLLVFHADDTMKMHKAYIATLIMGKDQVLAELKEEVLDASNARDDNFKKDTTLEIGTAMKAKLKDFSGSIEKGFDIDFLGDEGAEQRITATRKKLMWQWKLTPLTPGEQKLALSISITEKNGEKVNLPVRSIPVIIYAEQEATSSKIMGFFEKNMQWILATLFVPLFLGWYNARLRHKFDQKTFQNRAQNERNNAPDNSSQQAGNSAQNNQGGA